jgi:hypothetical protein
MALKPKPDGPYPCFSFESPAATQMTCRRCGLHLQDHQDGKMPFTEATPHWYGRRTTRRPNHYTYTYLDGTPLCGETIYGRELISPCPRPATKEMTKTNYYDGTTTQVRKCPTHILSYEKLEASNRRWHANQQRYALEAVIRCAIREELGLEPYSALDGVEALGAILALKERLATAYQSLEASDREAGRTR